MLPSERAEKIHQYEKEHYVDIFEYAFEEANKKAVEFIAAEIQQAAEEVVRKAVIESFGPEYRKIKSEALEEAEKACLNLVSKKQSGGLWSRGCRACVKAICALKEKV